MVMRYINAYLWLQSLVMCGNKFNMTKIGNMAIFQTWQHDLSMFAEFERLPCNPNFSQISQAFPLASLEFIK